MYMMETPSFKVYENLLHFFQAFRDNGAPTFYTPLKTPFQSDLLESGLIFAFVILAFSFFLILPGFGDNRGEVRTKTKYIFIHSN